MINGKTMNGSEIFAASFADTSDEITVQMIQGGAPVAVVPGQSVYLAGPFVSEGRGSVSIAGDVRM